MAILDRVKIRLDGDNVKDELLNELINTATDRICLRLGTTSMPSFFDSICTDVVVKAYRRMYYEGINSESADTLNTSFYEDILNEYKEEFSMWVKKSEYEKNQYKKVVRFI